MYSNAAIPYAIIVMMVMLLASSIASLFHRRKFIAFSINTALFVVIAVLSLVSMLVGVSYTLPGAINLNAFSELFTMLFSFLLALINILAYPRSEHFDAFSVFISLAFFGMFFVSSAASLLEIALGLEMVSLPTVFIIIAEGKNRVASAIKLFVLGVISITVFVFAVTLIFPYSPSLYMTAIQTGQGTTPYLLLLATVLFIASLGIETAQFPFNLWIPDVYQGAPGFATAMLAGVNKKVAFVALMEILFIVLIAFKAVFSPILVILSIVTMFFGNLVAMTQTNVKRMFAYSSISQAGYITIGLTVATQYGITASLFQIIAHAFMIIGAFSIVLWLEERGLHTIEDYSGMFYSNGIATVALTIFMLSMAGVPPLMGFYGKFLLFSSAASSNQVYLAVIGIVNSIISIYYYGRLINSVFVKREKRKQRMGVSIAAVVAITVFLVVAFGIYPQPVVRLATLAASALLHA